MDYEVINANCLDTLGELPENSIDAIVCDPPYGLGFMGKKWDALPPGQPWALACLRVLKPGGHLLAFGGTRTAHRLVCAVEDAGFEIRDQIGWVYYNGFPKSFDVSKAIDKAAGAEREVISTARNWGASTAAEGKTAFGDYAGEWQVTAPATPAARAWSGWGTALKPAIEPCVLARKALIGTVAASVLEHGTGALNIDACRFAPGAPEWVGPNAAGSGSGSEIYQTRGGYRPALTGHRWPANLFYCPKASRRERDRGTEGMPRVKGHDAVGRAAGSAGLTSPRAGAGRSAADVGNPHPTVKPVRLMRWLVRLVTPPGGLVVDPFAGSGSTGVAAVLEGFSFLGMDLDAGYCAIASARIQHAFDTPSAWADTAPGSKK